MEGFRFGLRCSLILFAALVFVQAGRTQISAPPTSRSTTVAVNKVYSLADLGDDPNLCKWIAETIPQMIKPGCWNGQNLCYYAPAKVLAIHQTPEVHAQVEEFLANMRRSLPREKTTASRAKHDGHVVPVQFNPDGLQPVSPASASQAYPVPLAPQTPKHLFHFIIRYEGAGIIDSNVTKFAQALTKANASNESVPTSASDASLLRTEATLPSPHYLKHAPQYLPPSDAPRMPAADQPPSLPSSSDAAPPLHR